MTPAPTPGERGQRLAAQIGALALAAIALLVFDNVAFAIANHETSMEIQ
jgi:hypothetical protein